MATPPADASARQRTLIRALRAPAAWPHPVDAVRHIETHISHVLLTGGYAYKIKKPVELGFLDFSTAALRRHFCEEELRLNRRLAPSIYLEVVPIAGSPEAPRVGGAGPPIEYAVKMREFPQEALMDAMAAAGTLAGEHIDALAARLAVFHAEVARAGADSPHGTPAAIEAPVRQNFDQMRALGVEGETREALDRIERWSLAEHARLAPLMRRRHDEGYVRECHGDLHLGNIAWVDHRVEIFDCIEFNPELRWIDVFNEAAFLAMDLEFRALPGLAARFLDGYLANTGDYAGVALARNYEVYRAMVRAKVAAMRAAQQDAAPEVRAAAAADCRAHLAVAGRWMSPGRPALILTHGLAGSGKTTYAQAIVERLGAIRLRSDVERKRLAGLAPAARTGSALAAGLYGEQATRRTYERLARLAGEVLDAGFVTIVDATFLKRRQRELLRDVARGRGVPFRILSPSAPEALLRQRIAARLGAGEDASEATAEVLDWQIREQEPLAEDELACTIRIDAEHESADATAQRLMRSLPGYDFDAPVP
ncbi:MAG: AAA family ATPase [Rhodocyclaceae bacterium]